MNRYRKYDLCNLNLKVKYPRMGRWDVPVYLPRRSRSVCQASKCRKCTCIVLVQVAIFFICGILFENHTRLLRGAVKVETVQSAVQRFPWGGSKGGNESDDESELPIPDDDDGLGNEPQMVGGVEDAAVVPETEDGSQVDINNQRRDPAAKALLNLLQERAERQKKLLEQNADHILQAGNAEEIWNLDQPNEEGQAIAGFEQGGQDSFPNSDGIFNAQRNPAVGGNALENDAVPFQMLPIHQVIEGTTQAPKAIVGNEIPVDDPAVASNKALMANLRAAYEALQKNSAMNGVDDLSDADQVTRSVTDAMPRQNYLGMNAQQNARPDGQQNMANVAVQNQQPFAGQFDSNQQWQQQVYTVSPDVMNQFGGADSGIAGQQQQLQQQQYAAQPVASNQQQDAAKLAVLNHQQQFGINPVLSNYQQRAFNPIDENQQRFGVNPTSYNLKQSANYPIAGNQQPYGMNSGLDSHHQAVVNPFADNQQLQYRNLGNDNAQQAAIKPSAGYQQQYGIQSGTDYRQQAVNQPFVEQQQQAVHPAENIQQQPYTANPIVNNQPLPDDMSPKQALPETNAAHNAINQPQQENAIQEQDVEDSKPDSQPFLWIKAFDDPTNPNVVDCLSGAVVRGYNARTPVTYFKAAEFPEDSIEDPSNRAESFQKIHLQKAWLGGQAIDAAHADIQSSGVGSTLSTSLAIRNVLHMVIHEIKRLTGKSIIRILDVACGDMVWMHQFLLPRDDVEYVGIDIVPELITHHVAKYGNNRRWRFVVGDILNTNINEKFDLIISRQMMAHLTNRDTMKALEKFSNSQATFLLASTFPRQAINFDLQVNNAALMHMRYRPQNLELYPYRLSPPICIHEDIRLQKSYIALWKLPLTQVSNCSLNPSGVRNSDGGFYSCA